MVTVATRRRRNKNGFDAVAEPVLQGEGRPFADVLSAEWIQRVFCKENALFGQDDIFSTEIVLWAFLAQAMREGKGAACSAAVSEIATYMPQTGQRPPSGDTGGPGPVAGIAKGPGLAQGCSLHRRRDCRDVPDARGESGAAELLTDDPRCHTLHEASVWADQVRGESLQHGQPWLPPCPPPPQPKSPQP